MATVAVPCTCGAAPEVGDSGGYALTLSCPNCYDADCVGDPPEFVSTSPCGVGFTMAEAVGLLAELTR